ncbi:EF-hand domain-containing protein [Massilia niabensis]|uniref:EF-hand domain-containing protein n=1 Tax=Massilia niabensis TaxID=544910 RepID=A0ABW0LA33_9BURK
MKTMHLLLLFVSVAHLAAPAAAQAPIGVDGLVPPALRIRPAEPPAAGAALRAQALAKLEAQFRAADLDGNGSLTLEESKGFGFVASHFDDIDAGRRGAVTFDDLRAYLARAKADRRQATRPD